MKNYYRIILGPQNSFVEEAYKDGFIAAGFIRDVDLINRLYDKWRDFNKAYIPVFLQQNPQKTKIAAGLACGMLWTIARGIQIGDIVLCPNGKGAYYIAEVTGQYEYRQSASYQHRRAVRWLSKTILRNDMSETLRNATGGIGTLSNISKYASEIESLVSGDHTTPITSSDEAIEDPSIFALEKHLEDFLVQNWSNTELGRYYDIYKEDEEVVGQQYPSDTGPIDILAISKDKRELLIVELKKGRASDVVVGQIQRYMGYIQQEMAEEGQRVGGAIIAFQDDIRIRRALAVTQNIKFYTYKVIFKLEKK